MIPPISAVLIKIFSKGFFKANSGLLTFLFVMIVSYCFFINPLGDIKLISSAKLFYYQFLVVISFVTSPLAALIICASWLVYTVKSWNYVIKELSVPNNQFLFHSITSLRKSEQVRVWIYVQGSIFAPIFFYWVFAMVFGIAFHQYILPIMILLYVLILTLISAWLYVYELNRPKDGSKESVIFLLTKEWNKPYFSIALFQLLDKQKLSYAVTKLISYLIITGVIAAFPDAFYDSQVAAIAMLLIATAHSFVVFQNHRFEEERMSFVKTFPTHRLVIFSNLFLMYFILILPESIWLFTKYNIVIALTTILLGISTMLTYRVLLYWLDLKMNRYLPLIMMLFILFFYTIMFKFIAMLMLLNLIVSFILFYKQYYQNDSIYRS